MIALSFVAAFMLPFAAAFSWRVSRYVSIGLLVATLGVGYWIGSILLHVSPWDWARWIVAWLTGCVGAFELRSVGAPRHLGALLVGSSVADFVSLYREAHGGTFGALPVLTIVVLLAMIWISRRAVPSSESTPVPIRPEFFREQP